MYYDRTRNCSQRINDKNINKILSNNIMDKSILFLILLLSILSFYKLSHFSEKKYQNNSFVKPEHNLFHILSNISSSSKVVLKEVKEKWSLTKQTIDPELNQKVVNLIKKVLTSITYISNIDFYINEINNVYIMKDKYGDFRCIVNADIYDVKNYYTIKLVIDFTSINGIIYLNYIDIDHSALNNLLNKYDIRWKSQGILSQYNMFDEDVQKLLDNHYDKNFNLVKLDRNSYTTDTINTFTLDQLTTNYLPVNTPQSDSPMFGQKNTFNWDSKAIPISTDNSYIMHNSSITPYPNEPYQAPGVVINPNKKNDYDWIRRTSISNSL